MCFWDSDIYSGWTIYGWTNSQARQTILLLIVFTVCTYTVLFNISTYSAGHMQWGLYSVHACALLFSMRTRVHCEDPTACGQHCTYIRFLSFMNLVFCKILFVSWLRHLYIYSFFYLPFSRHVCNACLRACHKWSIHSHQTCYRTDGDKQWGPHTTTMAICTAISGRTSLLGLFAFSDLQTTIGQRR